MMLRVYFYDVQWVGWVQWSVAAWNPPLAGGEQRYRGDLGEHSYMRCASYTPMHSCLVKQVYKMSVRNVYSEFDGCANCSGFPLARE